MCLLWGSRPNSGKMEQLDLFWIISRCRALAAVVRNFPFLSLLLARIRISPGDGAVKKDVFMWAPPPHDKETHCNEIQFAGLPAQNGWQWFWCGEGEEVRLIHTPKKWAPRLWSSTNVFTFLYSFLNTFDGCLKKYFVSKLIVRITFQNTGCTFPFSSC